jgi:OOP family OmpA-OmpF porin
LGLGVIIPLNERLAVRTGVKYIYDFDGEYDDGQATIGFNWKVGGGTAGSTKDAPEVVEPVAGDSDRDGVADSADQCPGTPYRVAVDANGCPLDQDGDGVPNYRDRCPETAPGTKVDHRGCKLTDVSTEKEELLVHFALNSAVVMPSYRSDFMRMAEFLKEHSGVSAVIEGHADHTGTLDYNQALSVRRAESVKAILVKKYGIDANRLRTIGYGETRPVASNDNAAGRQANRRAVAVVRIKSSN